MARYVKSEMGPVKPHYTLFNSIIQKIASTRPGSWVLARSLHRLDGIFLKLSRGRMNLTSRLSGLPIVVLTTTGARSGLPRSMPLAYIRDPHEPNQFALIASNWGQHDHPAWYYNLKANPQAICSRGGRANKYIAHEANEEEYAMFWRSASEIYLGFQLYKKRAGGRRIPIMVLTPEESSSQAME
jgi:deazaflavin-dependent oxidoreductase (nitroreductase family)